MLKVECKPPRTGYLHLVDLLKLDLTYTLSVIGHMTVSSDLQDQSRVGWDSAGESSVVGRVSDLILCIPWKQLGSWTWEPTVNHIPTHYTTRISTNPFTRKQSANLRRNRQDSTFTKWHLRNTLIPSYHTRRISISSHHQIPFMIETYLGSIGQHQ